MKALSGVRVVLVSEQRSLDHLAIWLQSEGAELHVCTWAGARDTVQRLAPGVLIADYRGAPESARALSELQAALGKEVPPTVVLLEGTAASPSEVSSPRVNKYLRAGSHPTDVVSAVAGLATTATPQQAVAEPSRADSFAAMLESQVQRRDLRSLLSLLNATGPFRYTAILRFDAGKQLTSLWTFDRVDPNTDSFPTGMTVDDSYCKLVLETGQPFEMPDAAADPAAQAHPARHSVLSYCGVPLLTETGSVFGTLCQFDVVPRYFQASTRERLQVAASVLKRHLATLTPG